MNIVEVGKQVAQTIKNAVEVVIYPDAARLNGRAILSRGLAAAYRAKAAAKGIDLEALVSPTHITLLNDELTEAVGNRGAFVPAVTLNADNTASVNLSMVQEAAKALLKAGYTPILYYWDEESRKAFEVEGAVVRYNQLESFRASVEHLDLPKGAVFITANPRLRLKMEAVEAFVASLPKDATLVTLARVSNITFVQAALKAGRHVIVLDPAMLSAWRPETLALIEGAEIIQTAQAYEPGVVTRTVRSAIASTEKSFGVEPHGFRSEAGIVPTNLWDKFKPFSSMSAKEQADPALVLQ